MPLSRTLVALLVVGSLTAAEVHIATPFEVRRDLAEFLADLAKATPADGGTLLERVATLLATQADTLVETPDGGRPLGAVVLEALDRANLRQAYAQQYAPRAATALETATTVADLRRVAVAFPGTPAAATAWARVADRSWDQGRVGRMLEAVRQGGDRDPRLATARQLARPDPGPPAPERLQGLNRAWGLGLGSGMVRPPVPLRRQRAAEALPRFDYAFGTSLGEATVVSDAQRMTVIDHLLGRIQGSPVVLGNQVLPAAACRPAAVEDGWIGAGLADQRLVLARVDRTGGLRWRIQGPDLGFAAALSAPVVCDGVVALTAIATDGDSGSLRVLAWDVRDGRPAWTADVGRVSLRRFWSSGDAGTGSPQMIVHDGALLVLSHAGMLVRVGTDGVVSRVWSYRPAALPEGFEEGGEGRSGGLAGDGLIAVAAPADAPDRLLILDGSADPRPYTGDGAAALPLAVANGVAYLGGRRLLALDLAANRLRWDVELPAVQVQPGPGHLLVTAPGQVAVVNANDGGAVDRFAIAGTGPALVGLADGWLILAQSGEDGVQVSAWGDPGPARARLTAAAEGGSWNAAAALASLTAASGAPGSLDEALEWYRRALLLGAPADYAAKAAGLARSRLEDAPDPVALTRLLGLLDELARRDPALVGEAAYWRGRLLQDRQALERAELAPPVLVGGPSGVAVDVRLLAAAALGRPPRWEAVSSPALSPGPPWSISGRRAPGSLVASGRVVGYQDGVLVAHDLASGQEAWWRRPGRPLLGVQSGNDHRGAGVLLSQVLPGSSAAAAGLVSGDILLNFNGRDMRTFTGDLVPAVVALGVRGAFTAVVRREGVEVTCRGTLGGELVEAVAADASTVLVWPTALARTLAGVPAGVNLPQTVPEGLWVEALDAATGTRRWRQAIPPATTDGGGPARPLLVDGIAILADGPDLLGREAVSGKERWRLGGAAHLLATARPLGRALWAADTMEGVLLDPTSGVRLVVVAGAGSEARIEAGDLLVTGVGGLRRIDLWQRREAWTAPGIGAVLAVEGDGVWAISESGPLVLLDRASGRERRRYGDWPGVAEAMVSGGVLVVHAQGGPERSWLAGITLNGGAVIWSHALPPESEVLRLVDDGQGPAVVLGQGGLPVAVIHLTSHGAERGMTPLGAVPAQARIMPMPDGAVALHPGGVQRLGMHVATVTPRTWPIGTTEDVPGVGPVVVQATTGGLRLRWQPGVVPQMALSIADPGSPWAGGALRALVSAAGVAEAPSGTPWTVTAIREGDAVIIDILTVRLAGAPLLLRLAPGIDGDPVWWWTRTWRVVTGAR